MASIIKLRSYAGIDDKRIETNGSYFARPHGVSPWSKLRVALRISATDSGAAVTGTPDFSVGLCAGTTNIYKNTTTDHFVGVQTVSTSWLRGAGSFYQASASSPYMRVIKRVGTTLTAGGTFTLIPFTVFPGIATAHRWLYFVDITKGSPNYTFDIFTNAAANTIDISAADFLTYSALNEPTVAGHSFEKGKTIAVSESTDGILNCVNVFWEKTDPLLEFDIAVARLA